MLVQGIKSRPVYTGLTVDQNAQRHVFVLEGEGPVALLEQVSSIGSDFLNSASILYTASGSTHAETLSKLHANDFWMAPTIPVLINRLRIEIINAKMGTRFYIAGTEGFIGQAMKVAIDHGIDYASIRTEHRGSLARRVQCVHCKGITENVKTSPYICSHCGLSILVRDHYSRRLAAFQGVNIDAENPGTAPPPEVIFP
jgi:dimethylamine monooxygenase subunit C